MTIQVIGGVVAAKWYEVDSFVSYLGSRISGSWDLGVGRELEGKESQMTDLTDLAGWTDGRAVGWERKRFREGMVWRGDEFSLAMLSFMYLWKCYVERELGMCVWRSGEKAAWRTVICLHSWVSWENRHILSSHSDEGFSFFFFWWPKVKGLGSVRTYIP